MPIKYFYNKKIALLGEAAGERGPTIDRERVTRLSISAMTRVRLVRHTPV